MTKNLSLLLIAAITFVATSASAQKMYRCNNTYQDHPCSGGQEGKTATHGSGSDNAQVPPASAKVNTECSRRGAAAQKIKWVREAGQTQQQQEAAATSSGERGLIADVYARQGTSGQVRSAIEADCMAEVERSARAAALLEAANTLKSGGHSTAARNDASSSQNITTSSSNVATPSRSDTDSFGKQAACQRLADQLNGVRASQRAGADARRMDDLRQQHKEITDKRREAGC